MRSSARRQAARIVPYLPTSAGYVALFLIILGESAGLPVPGETSLATAGVMAADGRLVLPLVILVAAAAAILGDNVGFYVGRRSGRRLLTRDGFAAERRRRLLAEGERVFEAHGPWIVFAARWLPLLRFAGGVLAGAHGMRWRRFLIWNAAGGLAWAASVSSLAYALGSRAGGVLEALALSESVLLAAAVVTHVLWRRARRRSAARLRAAAAATPGTC